LQTPGETSTFIAELHLRLANGTIDLAKMSIAKAAPANSAPARKQIEQGAALDNLTMGVLEAQKAENPIA